MKFRTLGIVLFFLGMLVIATPVLLLPVCEYRGHERMVCTYTAYAEVGVGIIILSAAAGVFFSKTHESLRWLMVTMTTSGSMVLLLPSAIGFCRMSSMPCNYGTVPALRLEGILIIAVALAGMAISFMKDRGGR